MARDSQPTDVAVCSTTMTTTRKRRWFSGRGSNKARTGSFGSSGAFRREPGEEPEGESRQSRRRRDGCPKVPMKGEDINDRVTHEGRAGREGGSNHGQRQVPANLGGRRKANSPRCLLVDAVGAVRDRPSAQPTPPAPPERTAGGGRRQGLWPAVSPRRTLRHRSPSPCVEG